MPNREAIATKLLLLTESDNPAIVLKAIQEILDRTEGKPLQTKETIKKVAPQAININLEIPDNCPHCGESLLDESDLQIK